MSVLLPSTDIPVCPPPLDRQECLSSLPTSAPGAAAGMTTLPHPPPCFPAGAGSPPGQSELGVEVEGPASACPRLPMLPEHPAQKPHPVEFHQTAVAADRMDEPGQGRKVPRKPGWNTLRRLPGETIRAIDAGLARARHLGGSTLATTRFYRTPPLSAGAGFGPFHCLRPARLGRDGRARRTSCGPAVPAFQLGNLLDAACVPAALELGVQPNRHEPVHQPVAQNVAG